MPRQEVEFEFPDPDKEKDIEVEVTPVEEPLPELEIEGAVGRETIGKAKEKEEDAEIEVVSDVPPEDRGRKPSEPPEEVTNKELENYSDKVKKRIQHFSKGYHDERRAKETAQREREELERYARKLLDDNQKLKSSVNKGHNALIASAKKQTESEVTLAKKQYREAYEAGEAGAVVEAQDALTSASIRKDKVANLRPRAEVPLQTGRNAVQSPESVPQQPEVQRDPKAIEWANNNSWFGSDDEMTAFALGLHTKLTKEGVNPQSDDYYGKINARMREIFPGQFDDGIDDSGEPRKKSSTVVAPATRSTGPKKIRLTESQQTIARRLGVPLKQYAEQVAELARKQY
jgi:hypothetical protein